MDEDLLPSTIGGDESEPFVIPPGGNSTLVAHANVEEELMRIQVAQPTQYAMIIRTEGKDCFS